MSEDKKSAPDNVIYGVFYEPIETLAYKSERYAPLRAEIERRAAMPTLPELRQQWFEKAARAGLLHADIFEVTDVACAIWREDFTPDLARLRGQARRDAAYLVDRLSRYEIVTPARQKQLQALLPKPPKLAYTVASRDKLAQKWGATADLKRFLAYLQPYQSRH